MSVHILIDVDDTIVTDGQLMPGVEEGLAMVREGLKTFGSEICVWSHGGASRAAEWAKRLNLEGHACKPDIVVDDEPRLTSTPLRVKPSPGEAWPDLAKRVCKLAEAREALVNHVAAVQKHVEQTDHRYTALYSPTHQVQPIPFFGNILQAKVITVGLNPVYTEFHPCRWPTEKLEAGDLTHRLLNYFQEPQAFPHRWFRVWEEALRQVRCSYFDGSAAHIDLSPRATLPAGEVESACFIEMVREDMPSFRDTLLLSCNAHHGILAGTVTSDYYMPAFLGQYGGPAGLRVLNEQELHAQTPAFCNALTLSISVNASHQRELPAFYCSVSPSAENNRTALIARIREHWSRYLELVSEFHG